MHNSNKNIKRDKFSKSRGALFIKIGIVGVCVLGFSAVGSLLYTKCEEINYDGCYKYKLQLLRENKNTNKALFIGGSATNFGIHASKFESETGIKAINMGFSAGRSFEAYLDSVSPYLKDGDYLFLCPEIAYWNSEFHTFDKATMMFYQYQNIDALKITSFGDFWNFIKYGLINGWEGWYNSFSQFSKDVLIEKLHVKSEFSIYDRWSCNTNGDFTYHIDKTPQEFNPEKISSDLTSYTFCDSLKNYINQLKQRINITPYIIFSPIDEFCTKESEGFDELAAKIESRTGIKTLFNQKESSYPHSYFFDTQYHMKWDYAENYYSDLVIKKFKESQNNK